MGPIRSGALRLIGALRTTAATDTTHPNTANPTNDADNVLQATGRYRSRDAWVVVRNTAADAGVSVTVTLYGSLDGAAGSWRVIGQLNNGAAITPTTNSSTTVANRLFFAEAVPGLLGWPFLYATVTGGTIGQSTIVEAYGEG